MLPSLSLMRTLMYAAASASAAASAAAAAAAAADDDDDDDDDYDACRYKATATRQIIIEVQPQLPPHTLLHFLANLFTHFTSKYFSRFNSPPVFPHF
jgi:hypothetical protein